MSHRLLDQTGSGVVAEIPVTGITYGHGSTVPTNGALGYAPNCVFLKTNATGGVGFYINTGTVSSAAFLQYNGGIDLSGLLATAAELNRVAKLSTRVVAHASGDPATLSMTAALHDGKTLYVTKTDGLAITLPAPVAGMRFRIVIGATIASASSIKSLAGSQIMIGHARMGNNSDNSTVDWQAIASSTYDTIDLLGTSNSTGGIEGQIITIEAMSTTVWFVEIAGDAAGTEATPFADTVT